MRKSMWSREWVLPLLLFGCLLWASGFGASTSQDVSLLVVYECCEGKICQDQDCRVCDLARRLSLSPENMADFRKTLAEDSFCGPDHKSCCCSASR